MKRLYRSKATQPGITLVELLVVLGILAILAAMAAPSFQDEMRKRRVQGAAEGLAAAMQTAKAEAIKRNRDVWIVFTPTGANTDQATWCYGMKVDDDSIAGTNNATDDDCDCTGATTPACSAGSVVRSSDYSNKVSVNFNTGNTRNFSPLRGTATSGTVTFTGGSNISLGVSTSSIGRIRLCLPSGSKYSTNSGAC